MAEAIEINFPNEKENSSKIDPETKKQILGFNIKESLEKDGSKSDCPEAVSYTHLRAHET